MFDNGSDYTNAGLDRVIIAVVVCYLAATLASAGGIGGGGLILPILLVVGDFDFEGAVILSMSAVFGNTLSQIIVNSIKRHPIEETRPLVDFDQVSILLPAQLAGANVGMQLSRALPSASLMIVAMVILIAASFKIFRKGIKLYKKETEDLKWDRKAEAANALHDTQQEIGHDNRIRSSESTASKQRRQSHIEEAKAGYRVVSKDYNVPSWFGADANDAAAVFGTLQSSQTTNEEQLEAMEEIHDFDLEVVSEQKVRERVGMSIEGGGAGVTLEMGEVQEIVKSKGAIVYPLPSIMRIAAFWTLSGALILTTKQLFAPCSASYSLMLAASFVPLIVALVGGIYAVSIRQRDKPATVLLGDIDYSKAGLGSSQLYLAPAALFITGVLCSLLGIGGGELIGTLFLSLGMLPQVAAASTSLMTSTNACLNVIQYLTSGSIAVDWCLLLFMVGASGGLSGRWLSRWVIKTYGRPSICVFALSVILLMSVTMLSYELSHKTKAEFEDLEPLCE